MSEKKTNWALLSWRTGKLPRVREHLNAFRKRAVKGQRNSRNRRSEKATFKATKGSLKTLEGLSLCYEEAGWI